ncbi:hypothetical protein LOD99_7854 [Oopsacas minuta]|uniref:Uncharacterized protein n=1 Tax=Oopsacas minuta TaxID=111878 RepID=A0AAV7JP95_9METZ|nr:hypothetical protein LOD99_7854 [Oopsacas minuta]
MKGVVGPLFFEEQEKTVTINTDSYLKILEVFWKELKRTIEDTCPNSGSNRMEQPPIPPTKAWIGSRTTSEAELLPLGVLERQGIYYKAKDTQRTQEKDPGGDEKHLMDNLQISDAELCFTTGKCTKSKLMPSRTCSIDQEPLELG